LILDLQKAWGPDDARKILAKAQSEIEKSPNGRIFEPLIKEALGEKPRGESAGSEVNREALKAELLNADDDIKVQAVIRKIHSTFGKDEAGREAADLFVLDVAKADGQPVHAKKIGDAETQFVLAENITVAGTAGLYRTLRQAYDLYPPHLREFGN